MGCFSEIKPKPEFYNGKTPSKGVQLSVHCQFGLLLLPLESGGQFFFTQCQEEPLASVGGPGICGWQAVVRHQDQQTLQRVALDLSWIQPNPIHVTMKTCRFININNSQV